MTKKLKPFDLEAALRGEPVILRDGSKAFVRHHETELPTGSCWQIWGIGNRTDGRIVFLQWSTSGGYDMDGAVSDLDIVGMYQKTRTINGFEVPIPETEELKVGNWYFSPRILSDEFCEAEKWIGGSSDLRALNRGLVFLTKEDAIANAKAMLGIDPYGED